MGRSTKDLANYLSSDGKKEHSSYLLLVPVLMHCLCCDHSLVSLLPGHPTALSLPVYTDKLSPALLPGFLSPNDRKFLSSQASCTPKCPLSSRMVFLNPEDLVHDPLTGTITLAPPDGSRELVTSTRRELIGVNLVGAGPITSGVSYAGEERVRPL